MPATLVAVHEKTGRIAALLRAANLPLPIRFRETRTFEDLRGALRSAIYPIVLLDLRDPLEDWPLLTDLALECEATLWVLLAGDAEPAARFEVYERGAALVLDQEPPPRIWKQLLTRTVGELQERVRLCG